MGRTASLRAVTMVDSAFWSDKTKVSYWYRPDEASDWQLLEEFPVTGNYWIPISVLTQPDSLAVWSRHGRDTAAVFRYDARRREHAELMAGTRAKTSFGPTGWPFQPPSGNSAGRVRILSPADVDPGRWFLLGTSNMAMQEIAQFRPRVRQAEMRPMEIDEYLADDGLKIKAYLTLPVPTASLPPMIVLIQGGPNQRPLGLERGGAVARAP